MASEIDQAMKKFGEAKLGMEGSEDGRWTLIDYGDFVVHIFSPEDRAYYALEEIWGDDREMIGRPYAVNGGVTGQPGRLDTAPAVPGQPDQDVVDS